MSALAAAAVPLSLYVHLPWCVRKCGYCDFNSYEPQGTVPETAYVDALLADLAYDAPAAAGRTVETVFFGGGTPSLFSGAAIARLLAGIRATIALAPAAEITLEANPGTADMANFAAYREAGVNRLSIGVQSLRAAQLRRLGRVHDADTAIAAYEAARGAGFDNINLDLMYGLPGDRRDDSLRDLARLLELGPSHVSWYQLTIEPGTAFGRRPPRLPPSDRIAAEAEAGVALLAARDYARYEVSAYARPGRECRHNLNYWRFGDYLGIGAGAHGKLTSTVGIQRRVKRRQPGAYMKLAGTAAAAVDHTVAPHELVSEFMLNALRLTAGFERALFTTRTGLPWVRLEPMLNEAMRRGWLKVTPERVEPTALGYRFVDDVQLLFVGEPADGAAA